MPGHMSYESEKSGWMILTVGRFRHFPSTIWMRETVFPFKSAGFIYPHILIHRSGSGTHVGTTRCCRHWSRGEGLLCILSLPHNSKVFILKVFEKFSGLRGKAAYLSPPPPPLLTCSVLFGVSSLGSIHFGQICQALRFLLICSFAKGSCSLDVCSMEKKNHCHKQIVFYVVLGSRHS